MKAKHLPHLLFGIGLSFLLLLSFLSKNSSDQSRDFFEKKANSFDFKLAESRAFLRAKLEELGGQFAKDTSNTSFLFKRSEPPYGFFLFKEKELLSWNSNKLIAPEYYSLDRAIKFYVNGYYLFDTVHVERHVLAGVFKVKDEFQVENTAVSNNFASEFFIPEDFQIDVKSETYTFQHQISGSEAPRLFLSWNAQARQNEFFLWLELLGLGILILSCSLLLRNTSFFSSLQGAIYITAVVTGRLFLMNGEVLSSLKTRPLFQPQIYASSDGVPSLADLVLHVLALLWLGAVFWKTWGKRLRAGFRVVPGWMAQLGVLIFLYVSAIGAVMIIESLVIDSTLMFDLRDFTTYSLGLFVALGLLLLLLRSWLTMAEKLLVQGEFTMKAKRFMMLHLAVLFVLLLLSFIIDLRVQYYLWVFPLLSLYLWKASLNLNAEKRWRIWPDLLLLAVVCGGFAHEKAVGLQREAIERQVLQLAEERNLLAEFLIESAGEQLAQNPIFFVADPSHRANMLYQNQYLKYLTDFDFRSEESAQPLLMGGVLVPLSERLFQVTGQNNLHYILRVSDTEQIIWTHFETVDIPINKGFPSLLANKDIEKLMLDPRYSSAKYADGQLLNNKGKFEYPALWSRTVEEGVVKLYRDESFLHAIIARQGKVYIVSEAMIDWKDAVGLISALFFAGLFFSVFFRWIREAFITGQLLPTSLTGRFQLYLLLILFVSTAIVAIGTVNYMKAQFERTNAQALKEKLNLIRAEIQKAEGKALGSAEIEDIGNRHGVDLFVYNEEGKLIGSSQEKLFDWGLQTELVNPIAFNQIIHDAANLSIQQEEIGRLSFMSAYAPTYNASGEISHLINVPYFAKTDEIRLEINNFFSSLINLYLFFTAISLLLGLLLASRIAKPLQLIQYQMTKINFAGKNEKIVWDSRDEIGALVQQYNMMVDELDQSIKLLATAERESAWKEMAQQVAHEIKNPLTPMKLRLQYLNQQYNQIPEEERTEAVRSLTENLVDQIDTLTNIANEFSNFARLQSSKPERLELVGLIKGQIAMHSASTRATLHFQSELDFQELYFDKDHFMRIFNNLMSNAIQAIDEDEGQIEVQLSRKNGKILLKVQDNGTGIPLDIRDRVFEPNFTTKSSGMGLGLAMVKRMVEQGGATIYFETKIDTGTTFTVEFPER